jgi:hypothetical protein
MPEQDQSAQTPPDTAPASSSAPVDGPNPDLPTPQANSPWVGIPDLGRDNLVTQGGWPDQTITTKDSSGSDLPSEQGND